MSYTPSDSDLDNYLASLSGCDGGNLNAPYWICGIEWGAKTDEIKEPLVPVRVTDKPSWNKARDEDKPGNGEASFEERSTTWAYHQKVAKLLLSINDLQNGIDKTKIDLRAELYKEYMRTKLYNSDPSGKTFKMNLYPFCSPSVKAKKAIPDLYPRCEKDNGRFDFFRNLRKEHKPKFVICTGITKMREFGLAFGFPDDLEHFEVSVAGGQKRNCYRYSDGVSTLIVTPFFGGRYGMNSDNLIIELAAEIVDIERNAGKRD